MTKKKATSKLTFQGIGQPKKTGNYTPPTPIPGCTDPNALNYDQSANVDDGSCILPVYGCTVQTDPNTFIDNQNYDPLANVNQVSATDTSDPCIPHVIGCMDPNYLEYDASHTQDTTPTSCVTQIVYGCTDPNASNYDSVNPANVDDGSCVYLGCTDPNAFNFNSNAQVDDGSCTYYACDDSTANNYNPNASPTGPVYFTDNSLCTFTPVTGCMDQNYLEYDPQATISDQSMCINLIVDGCMNPLAFNYNSSANNDDGSCVTALPPDNIPGAYLTTDTDIDPTWVPSFLAEDSILTFGMNSGTGSYPPSKAEVFLSQTNTGWVWNYTWNSYPTFGTIAHSGTGGFGIIDFTDVNGVSLGDGDVSGTVIYTWLALDGSGTVLHTETENVGTYDSANGVYTPNIPLTIIMGCMWAGEQNTQAYPTVNFHVPSICVPHVHGCTIPGAINYWSGNTIDDGSCIFAGCTDPTASNYDPIATIDDGSCSYIQTLGQHTNIQIGVPQIHNWSQGLSTGTGTNLWPYGSHTQPGGHLNVSYSSKLTVSSALLPGTGVLSEPYNYVVDYGIGCGTLNPFIDPATGDLFSHVTFGNMDDAGITTDKGNNFWFPWLPMPSPPSFYRDSQMRHPGFLNYHINGVTGPVPPGTGTYGVSYQTCYINAFQNVTTPSNLVNVSIPSQFPQGDASGQSPLHFNQYGPQGTNQPFFMCLRHAADHPNNPNVDPVYYAIRVRSFNANGDLSNTIDVFEIKITDNSQNNSVTRLTIQTPPL